MNIVLWILQIVLAVLFLMAGFMKATQPKEKLEASLPWSQSYSLGAVRAIGIAEILGALALILPAVTGIATILTPIAALALAVVMVLAIITHARRKDGGQAIGMTVVLLVFLLIVVWGRFGAYAL
jgi:uncharacterized membrane protein YphA (DoxX/SURF4 family)